MSRDTSPGSVHQAIGALAIIANLIACSGEREPKLGQALVKVNGAEITIHQLNRELQGLPVDSDPVQRELMRKKALDLLIDRQLLVAAAFQNKIDRDPEVMQAIERAREQILAQAYLGRQATSHSNSPSREQVEFYYQQNPQLFSGRQLFELRQLVLTGNSYTPDIGNFIERAATIEDVAVWLDRAKVNYSKSHTQRSTADLPTQLLPNLNELTKGRPFVIKDGSKVIISTIHYIKDTPVTRDEALGDIERFLVNNKARDSAIDTLSSLRANAKIEYLNESLDDHSKLQAGSTVPLVETRESKMQDDRQANSIARGVAGLK